MSEKEIVGILVDSDFYFEEGYQPIESTTSELGALSVGTECGALRPEGDSDWEGYYEFKIE